MTWLTASLFLIIGFLAGTAFFGSLLWNTKLHARGGGLAGGVAVQCLRLAGLGGLLATAASHGALALLLTALGSLLARPMVMRWVARGAA